MLELSERCARLRDDAISHTVRCGHYGLHRAVLFVLGMDEAADDGLSNTEQTAAGIAKVISCFPPRIQPGELIAGNNYDQIVPQWKLPEDNEEDLAELRRNGFTEEQIEAYLKARDRYCRGRKTARVEFSKTETDSHDGPDGDWSAIGRCVSSNHSVIGYEKLLRLGFTGLLDEISEFRRAGGDNEVLRAAERICTAGCAMGERIAGEARRLRDSGDPAYCREDLDHIIEVCSRVPRYPARTFAEAVQALWFGHVINTWEDHINANSLGRLDQILYPYYRRDLEAGRITKADAFELICCLWIKLYLDYDVQQSAVGGTDADGNSTVNDLSFLMLDATERLNFIRCMSVRYSSKTDPAFLRRALEVVRHVGKGVPFFFNDEAMIPALEYKGIPHRDAVNYTQIGCVETVIPGLSNPHAVSGETNLLKALEYALNHGRSMTHPERSIGLDTGDPEELDTYEKLYAAVYAHMENILDICCRKIRKGRDAEAVNTPAPFKSLLTEDCLRNRKDFNDGGARYDYYQVMLGGVPNLADSLMVLKKFVYEDGKYTLREVKTMLDENFPDEAVRRDFLNKAPKYGNDSDEVDSIAVRILNDACDILERMSERYGLSFHAQPFTFLWMIDQGRETGATPDGRRSGEITAYSLSPMQGRDFTGLTAVLRSLCKLPTKRTPGTTSAIIEVDPKLFSDENLDVLTDLMLDAAAMGLSNIQFNTTDAETLMDAQKHPDRYPNLAVRVSGFSQKFNLLGRDMQDHIISRTKHQCL